MGALTHSVLVLDDDIEDVSFFSEVFLSVSPLSTIVHLKKGGECFEYFAHDKTNPLPTIVLMDYNMPPLTACDFLDFFCGDKRFVSILKVTWSTTEYYKDACIKAGAEMFFLKPWLFPEMTQLVNEILFLADQKNLGR